MPNRWTRVPDTAAPPLPAWAAWAVAPADIFMLAMVSRPATGSLRNTWVTPGTLLLAALTATGGAIVAVICGIRLAGGAGWPLLLALVVVAMLTLGAAAVALVALGQRSAREA